MRAWICLWTLCVVVGFLIPACPGVKGKLVCETNNDCFKNYVCDQNNTKICLRRCTEATETDDCLDLQYCDVPSGAAEGVCRDGKLSGTDGGDTGGDDDGDSSGSD